MTVIDKYNLWADKINSLLCVGLDSEFEKLPAKFRKKKNPQSEFNKWIIDQTHKYAAAYKSNIAFYEARGDRGIRELKMTMEYLQKRYPDIFTICDCKRADIDNTNNGYVKFFFDWLGFDAVTLHPYLGKEALRPFLERKDKGCIILCRTSNPGAGEFQNLKIGKKPIWQVVAEKVTGKWDKNKNCMLVVGATYPKEMKKIRKIARNMTFLVPGIGAQGGNVKDIVKTGLNLKGKGMIINSSRGIIFSRNPGIEAKNLRDEINLYR